MNPLILKCNNFFEDFNHPYAICGGYALELFANASNRSHSDLDITIFHEDKQNIISYVLSKGWNIYEPKHNPDSLRLITDANTEMNPACMCLWAVKPECTLIDIKAISGSDNLFAYEIKNEEQLNFDFIEIIFNVQKDSSFVCDAAQEIQRKLDKAILFQAGIPYLAPEIILFFIADPAYLASDYHKEKNNLDWNVIPPLLPQERLQWLIDALIKAYPDGNGRLDEIMKLREQCHIRR